MSKSDTDAAKIKNFWTLQLLFNFHFSFRCFNIAPTLIFSTGADKITMSSFVYTSNC